MVVEWPCGDDCPTCLEGWKKTHATAGGECSLSKNHDSSHEYACGHRSIRLPDVMQPIPRDTAATEYEELIKNFHILFYNTSSWKRVRWMGHFVLKNPFDLLVYQEIIFDTKPDVIIETGTALGGSALFFAHMLDLLGNGMVVTIDFEHYPEVLPKHPRIKYVVSPSTGILARMYLDSLNLKDKKVMVILDSDHTKKNVLKELDVYAPMVSKGCYLIVEDTNVNSNPVLPEHGPGPKEAVDEWLPKHSEFENDVEREKFFVSSAKGGFLRRK